MVVKLMGQSVTMPELAAVLSDKDKHSVYHSGYRQESARMDSKA